MTEQRTQYKDAARRKAIDDLQKVHRITYMAERAKYYERRTNSKVNNEKTMSIIIDGMAQSHTKVPHLANQNTFPACVDQHIIGVIQHDNNNHFNIYRTFGTIDGGSNLIIHCM